MTTTNDESGPVWIIKDPAFSYHGYETYPGTVDRKLGPAAYPGDMGPPLRPDNLGVTTIPPLNPQQTTPEDMERELNELRADLDTANGLFLGGVFGADGAGLLGSALGRVISNSHSRSLFVG